jgi:hypothetical protein
MRDPETGCCQADRKFSKLLEPLANAKLWKVKREASGEQLVRVSARNLIPRSGSSQTSNACRSQARSRAISALDKDDDRGGRSVEPDQVLDGQSAAGNADRSTAFFQQPKIDAVKAEPFDQVGHLSLRRRVRARGE